MYYVHIFIATNFSVKFFSHEICNSMRKYNISKYPRFLENCQLEMTKMPNQTENHKIDSSDFCSV